jgi:hypothetical protein
MAEFNLYPGLQMQNSKVTEYKIILFFQGYLEDFENCLRRIREAEPKLTLFAGNVVGIFVDYDD